MTTLTGGVQIATQGMTQADNAVITTILTQQVGSGTATVDTVAPTQSQTTVATVSGGILLGNLRASSVTSVDIAPSASGSGTSGVAFVDTSAVTSAGQVTNLVVNNTTSNVVLSGTKQDAVSVVFTGSTTSVVVGDAGSNFIVGNSSTPMTVVTGAGADSVLGGTGGDSFRLGDSGVANGGGGADTLIGGTGFSTLGGGAGADSIVAGAGGGFLLGEAGTDTLVGGAGKDVAIFSPGDGNDTFVGFDPTQDTLAFSNVNYTGGTLDIGALIRNATVVGGNTILTLPDGSTVTVVGVTGVNINWFTVK